MTRIRFGLAAIFVVCASVFFAAPAAADTQPDPQLSNVASLAWRGEQVRLVKCEPGLVRNNVVFQQQNGFRADFLLVDWSGDPHLIPPQLEPGTVSFFRRSFDQAPCVGGTFTSQKAGLAQIKLVISENGTALLKHDFLVAWMEIGNVTLSELGPNPLPAGVNSRNQLRVDVTGTFPLLQNFGELGLGNSLTMPADWPRLARAVATSRGPLPLDPSMLWDIHDDQTRAEGHGTATQSSCTRDVSGGLDAVDNCAGGGETGPFSRIWSGFTNPTIGPFDPQRAGETYLADGKLDAGDAPMPALRIDFAIAPNTPGGIGGVGSFGAVDKHVVYSRNGTGSSAAHQLYAPFYASYIPATAAPQPEASGTDGPQTGNNFNGYLNDTNPYHFWDIAERLGFGPGGTTACARLVARDTRPIELRRRPSGLQNAVVYTDEHGEARIDFIAGLDFFFDNLGALLNANGGCDLAGIATLGTATITATARYPYQFVTARPETSNPITKVVQNRFLKSIQCFPKGPGPQNAIAAICVAHAQDIDGTPFVGETICFMADFNAMDIQFFGGVIAGINLAGTSQVFDTRALRRICVVTNSAGNAAVEIFNSNPTLVDVTAFFLDEGLLRSIKVQFPITAPTPVQDGTLPLQSSPSPNSGGSTAPPPAGGGGSPSGTPAPGGDPGATPAPGGGAPGGTPGPNAQPAYDASDFRIVKAKLRRPARGRPFMVIQVNGPTRTVTVRVRMMSRTRELGAVTYAVETGKQTRIQGLRIPTAARMLRLSVQV